MTIESNRTMGGIAACLFVTGVVGQVASIFEYSSLGGATSLAFLGVAGISSVLAFVALILFFVAMYGFSKDYAEPKIFNYLMYGFVAAILGGIIAVVLSVAFSFQTILSHASTSASPSVLQSSFWTTLPAFAVVSLIWILFNFGSLNLLGHKSEVPLFRTGATVLLAGSALTLVTAITFAVIPSSLTSNRFLLDYSVPGGLLEDVAWVLLAMAYFRIQAPLNPVAAPVNISWNPTVSAEKKYCPRCGAPTKPGAQFCSHCGKNLAEPFR